MKKYYFNKSIVFLVASISLTIFLAVATGVFFEQHMDFTDVALMSLSLLAMSIFLKYVLASFRNKPALVIDTEGIRECQSGLTFLWKDIQGYKINKAPLPYIVLHLNRPEEYIKTLKNPIIRLFRQSFKIHSFYLNISLLTERNEMILDQIEYYDLEFQRAFLESL